VSDVLRIEHLSKTFPGQVALDDVSIDVAAGEVHALVGQNGSGKSTLIKVLAGYHQPDQDGARAWVSEREITLGDGQAAINAGVRFVHQDLGLIGMLNAVDNIALTAGYQTGVGKRIHWRKEVARTRTALAELGLADVDIMAPVDSLPPSHRTAIAIARALIGWEEGASLLILDEPTATLPGPDVKRLFEIIHRLKARGVSILYVSHHLDEVFELADRVTVLRDGKKAIVTNVSTLDHVALVELIVGHHIETTTATIAHEAREPILTIRNLRGGNVHGINLDVAPGEIVGIAGITGSGREHALGLLSGQIPRDAGSVVLDGTRMANYDPNQAIQAGFAFVPAERGLRGAIGPMTVRENLSICDVHRHFIGGRLRRKNEIEETQEWIDRLKIKTAGTEAMIGALSGGNQQKVMFGKALRLGPKVLLLDEPTQGIDIGAKDQIYRLIDQASRDGLAVIVASTDTDELVRLCHRVVVLTDGRERITLVGDHITTDKIEHTQLESSRRAS
jgi:ribose transport system ATP-binding protein